MDKFEIIQLFQRELQKSTCDSKAEPQLVLALEKGLRFDDFMVCCDGLFYREYNKDVMFTETREDPRKLSVLQLHLTRSGVYDHLPEGLFYQPGDTSSKNYKAANMALDHRKNNQKEQEIRRFFLPFENDFFWQRIQLEREETTLLEGLQSGMLNDYFIKFWGIPASIPKKFIVSLVLLLPYAHKIAGNIELMQQCLEHLLQEKVQVKKLRAPGTSARSVGTQALGNQQLGTDMICGEDFEEDYPVLEFTIGPLQHSRVPDYLEAGKNYTFLQTFYQFFVPAGVDTPTNIEVPTEHKNMLLEPGNEPVLGYSSVL